MKKSITILFMLFMFFGKLNAQSYELVIQMNDNSEVAWTSESLKNVYFDGETTFVVVESENYLTHSYNLSEIKKLYFNSKESVPELNQENALFVYPNPAKDEIRIIGIENQEIKISSADGKTMFEGRYEGSSLNVSNFPQGTYIITTDANCQTLKFIKL